MALASILDFQMHLIRLQFNGFNFDSLIYFIDNKIMFKIILQLPLIEK